MSFALFLDIDGVLNTRTTVVGAPSGRTGIDESRVRLLKKALKQFGDAAIVLTSDWKLMREDGDDCLERQPMSGLAEERAFRAIWRNIPR